MLYCGNLEEGIKVSSEVRKRPIDPNAVTADKKPQKH